MATKASRRKRIVMTVGPNGPMARHGWKITTGASDALYTPEYRPTKAKAVKVARADCRRLQRYGFLVELKIKDRTGTIRDGRTFGKDPRRIKG